MKKIILIFLLIVNGMCYAFDNQPAQFPEATFKSVNNLTTGTQYTPQITPVGAYSPTQSATAPAYSPRRNNVVDPGTSNEDPYGTPIGDIPWIFMLSLLTLFVMANKKERVD